MARITDGQDLTHPGRLRFCRGFRRQLLGILFLLLNVTRGPQKVTFFPLE